MYPHLQHINLALGRPGVLLQNQQEMAVLFSCCPALKSLELAPCKELLYEPLSAGLARLTHLGLHRLDSPVDKTPTPEAAIAAVDAAAHLTGLHSLALYNLDELRGPQLLKLTQLTVLTEFCCTTSGTPAHGLHMRKVVSPEQHCSVSMFSKGVDSRGTEI
jgi:hypothetical protein